MPDPAPVPVTPDLPMQPADVVVISERFAMQTADGLTRYFHNLTPIDCHDADDAGARRLRIARLHVHNGISQSRLADAFGVTRVTVARNVKLYREQGEAGFFLPPRPRSRTVFDQEMIDRAREMLDAGRSGAAIARELGVATATFYENRKAGVFGPAGTPDGEPAAAPAASDRAARDADDRAAPMGRAASDVAGRCAAAFGAMVEAAPAFDAPHNAVAHGGVLTALPMLLGEGLVDPARRAFRLPAGFYGLTTVLLVLALMILARIRTPEQLRFRSPGEFGRLLGLDRCPEVKTLRRKLRTLSSSLEQVRAWQRALSKQWADRDRDAMLTLAVDGHVKVYAGRKGRVPKHFVARQKLSLPATVGYWVNALGGAPVMCLHKALDPKMVKALRDDVVPELRSAGVIPPDAPDLTGKAAAAPAVTLVFDREGWSPDLFRRLAREGVAVITWHKGFKDGDWEPGRFADTEVAIHGPAAATARTVSLAEGRVELGNGLEVRQIRRRLDNGRQVAIVTTHPDMPMAEVAGAMFSRWSQENYFKYMREEFALDLFPTHDLEQLDPDAIVVNPAWRALDGELRRCNQRLGTLSRKVPSENKRAGHEAATAELRATVADLKQRKAATPHHVKAGELPDPLHALPISERLFLDIVRMIAYRAETRMIAPLIAAQPRLRNARKLLQGVFASPANIIPEPENGRLRVQILGLANDALDQAVQPLLDELNKTRTRFPGTELTLVYETNQTPQQVSS